MNAPAENDLYPREHTDPGSAGAMHAEIRPRGCPLCWPPGSEPPALPPLPPPPPPPPARAPSAAPKQGMQSLGDALARVRERQGKPPLDPSTLPPAPRTTAEYIAFVAGSEVSPWDNGPWCDRCAGSRRVAASGPTGERLKPGDEHFGELAPCPDCQPFLTDTRVKRFWSGAGLPEDTEGLNLETYLTAAPRWATAADRKMMATTLASVRSYLEIGLPEGRSLLLYGKPSLGKTVIGCAICRELIVRLNRAAVFQTAPKLIDRLRAAQRSEDGPAVDDLLDVLERAPILMLDDLGAEALARNGQSTEFVREKIFRLVDERKAHRLITIITTNHDLDTLAERLGERIADRLEQICVQVHVQGPNLRRRSAT